MDTSLANENPLHVCIVGLGFVGLPLAIEFWRSGCHVTGIDVDVRKIVSLRNGHSYVNDVSDANIQELHASERFDCTTEFDVVEEGDAIIVCVPTPLNDEGLPDLGYLLQASNSVADHLRKEQIFVLESSTFPGTTEDFLVPMFQKRGLIAGEDVYVAYSPERIAPGETLDIRKIPKVIGGMNGVSLAKAMSLYNKVFERVVPVSSMRVAELTKLLENTQRFINISMMNELVVLCNKLGINLWEAIEAASTKPSGFTPYFPGPGIGGHCIPVDPLYLEWFANRHGSTLEFVKLAHRVNERMPNYVVERILELAKQEKPTVLVVGVTYKRNVNDVRESAPVEVLRQLHSRHIHAAYFDPYVPELIVSDRVLRSISLVPDVIQEFDVVTILTNHSGIDYDLIRQHAKAILDTHYVFSKNCSDNIVFL